MAVNFKKDLKLNFNILYIFHPNNAKKSDFIIYLKTVIFV